MVNILKKRSSVIKILTLSVTILILTSCYTQKDKRFFQDSKSLPSYKSTNYVNYKIQVNDEILLRVITDDKEFVNLIGIGYGNTNNYISYRVYSDGTIDIPFVNSIYIKGKTIEEAESIIEKRMEEIKEDIKVKIALKNKVYTVIGDAGRGIFPIYKERLTIYQALAQSGEIALSGDRKHIKILRELNGKPEILEFDIRAKSVIDSKYYYIYPNDIIYVQREAASFYKTNSFGGLISLITTSITLFTTVYYFTKSNN